MALWVSDSNEVHGYFWVIQNINNSIFNHITNKNREVLNKCLRVFCSLPCIVYWFHRLIFKLVVFSMHQKEEFAFPVLLLNLKHLSKKASYLQKPHTKKEMNLSYIDFIGFGKKHFLKDKRLLSCFINDVNLKYSPYNSFWNNAPILNDWSTFVQNSQGR